MTKVGVRFASLSQITKVPIPLLSLQIAMPSDHVKVLKDARAGPPADSTCTAENKTSKEEALLARDNDLAKTTACERCKGSKVVAGSYTGVTPASPKVGEKARRVKQGQRRERQSTTCTTL